ncbi:gamma carbonic anhydrase family protein [Candidatus Endoriftia persephone]|jgi:carbonic anhydrase/acetyltransferase-like protein (isoleucine patch superfamily)|uniref:Carbonic anhydrase, family 3 n=3 Tax=Gammaproteobacteria TaxID=1236 RepID=G2FF31_9GAMM|nr:gamma carbonic anhydrase family protein [Candidatus Endoriftia persephone]EGV49978.1 carbonic anhydrase, family 3 [endosymbiont of Riftia pachyptila (vent Ph05)]EGW54578.1 carbonic anhydrase, family 3 [endosymbiont of Tevnia jerichonana (vent Tica)]USF87538.1 gamma carbonic anhydrase family protein [Candidatus Endoriftia persephone]
MPNNIRSFESRTPQVDDDAWVDETAVIIGDVSVGPQSSIWPMSVLRGDVHRITIGAASNIQDGSVLHVSHDSAYLPGGLPLLIGDRVTVGHQAILHACTIGDGCFIGMGARILDGAVLEPGAMVGAGSLVPPGKHLEGGYLWVGSPARRVRPLSEQEREFLDYSAQHYVRLAGRHRLGKP